MYPQVPKVSVWYRYRKNTELADALGTANNTIPNLPKRRVPVSQPYRTITGTPGIVVEGFLVPGVYLSGPAEVTNCRVLVRIEKKKVRAVPKTN